MSKSGELALVDDLKCNKKLGLLLSCQIHVAKLASSNRFAYFKVVNGPVSRVESFVDLGFNYLGELRGHLMQLSSGRVVHRNIIGGVFHNRKHFHIRSLNLRGFWSLCYKRCWTLGTIEVVSVVLPYFLGILAHSLLLGERLHQFEIEFI